MRTHRLIGILLESLIVVFTSTIHAQDWPQWRGINRDGKSADSGLLKEWPDNGPKLVWKASNLGKGFAGVAIVGDRLYALGDRSDGSYIMALNAENGKILWSTKFGAGGPVGRGDNSYAGPRCTPTVDGNLIYAIDQWGELVCVNLDGKIQWSKSYVNDFGGTVPTWGFAESPLIHSDHVVITPGGSKGAMVALNKKTGKLIWQSKDFTDLAHYSSIITAEIAGVLQYVQLTSEHVVGISAKDGSVLWIAVRVGRVAVIPTPIFDGSNYVYVTSGYNAGSNLFKISSLDGKFISEQVYASSSMSNHHGGVVKVGDFLYGYSDGKGLVCQNFHTGEVVWAEREKVKKCAVSYADGMLYCREERNGMMVLVEASSSGYVEKGRFNQPDRAIEMAWPHPVITNGKLYLRDQDVLLCYEVKVK